jgi:hypothetical protein
MKYLLIQVYKRAGLGGRALASTFAMRGEFDTLQEAEEAKSEQEEPILYRIIQAW